MESLYYLSRVSGACGIFGRLSKVLIARLMCLLLVECAYCLPNASIACTVFPLCVECTYGMFGNYWTSEHK